MRGLRRSFTHALILSVLALGTALVAHPAGATAPPAPPECNPATETYTNSTPVPIPTVISTVTSTIDVAGTGPVIGDLDVQTAITHSFSSDLDITLRSPAGTVVTLTTDNAAGNDNVFNGTIWDDDANPAGQVPYTSNNGTVTDHTYVNLVTATPLAPEESFAAFRGENPNGTWTLTISDDAGADGGSLNSWSLTIQTYTAPPLVTSTSVTNSTPVAIPTGPAVVTSTVTVAGAGTPIGDVDATTFITHTANSDLDVTLASPAGTVVTLTTDNGSTFDDVFNGTVWNDQANPGDPVPYMSNQGLVTDATYTNLVTKTPLVPEETMGAFIGEDPNGTWTLTISDDLSSNGGSLNSWSLTIATTALCDYPPVADPQTVSTLQNTPLPITLTGSDQDGDPITFSIASAPTHGSLAGAPPEVVYSPDSGYVGPDSFDFQVDDGRGGTDIATISISVTSNLPPTADPQSISLDEDGSTAIVLTGSDPESDPLTFSIESGPSHGTLTGTPPALTYTPAANYNGDDSFDFRVEDGNAGFDTATVSITVNPINDGPVANPQNVTTSEDVSRAITLTGSDVDGDSLAFSIVSGPSHGVLNGTPPALTYVPALNYHGPDSFVFQVDDGNGGTASATVSITVNSVNDPPVANPQSVQTDEDTPVGITLTGSDVDGDTITFTVTVQPAHGTLSGTAPNLTYTPARDYFGPDAFTFQVRDPLGRTGTAVVSITVISAPLILTHLEVDPTVMRLLPDIALFMSRLQATLTRAGTGDPIADREIIFRIGGEEICRGTTDVSGWASCGTMEDNINASLASGYEAEFLEDPDLAGTTGEGGLIVIDGTRIL